MVCKVNSIFDEIFKYIRRFRKSDFADFVKIILNKMSDLNNLRKEGTPLTLRYASDDSNRLLASLNCNNFEMSFSFLHDC